MEDYNDYLPGKMLATSSFDDSKVTVPKRRRGEGAASEMYLHDLMQGAEDSLKDGEDSDRPEWTTRRLENKQSWLKEIGKVKRRLPAGPEERPVHYVFLPAPSPEALLGLQGVE